MNNNIFQWMSYSIAIANSANDLSLHVGAVLVSNENKLICSSFSDKNANWATKLLSKINCNKFKRIHSLYLTINTLTKNDDFNINEILKNINIYGEQKNCKRWS